MVYLTRKLTDMHNIVNEKRLKIASLADKFCKLGPNSIDESDKINQHNAKDKFQQISKLSSVSSFHKMTSKKEELPQVVIVEHPKLSNRTTEANTK